MITTAAQLARRKVRFLCGIVTKCVRLVSLITSQKAMLLISDDKFHQSLVPDAKKLKHDFLARYCNKCNGSEFETLLKLVYKTLKGSRANISS